MLAVLKRVTETMLAPWRKKIEVSNKQKQQKVSIILSLQKN